MLPVLHATNFTLTRSAVVALVLFSAPHCPHSDALRLQLEAGLPFPHGLVAESTDASLADVAGVRSLPALRLYQGAAEPAPFHGSLDPAPLRSFLRRKKFPGLLLVKTAAEARAEAEAASRAAIVFAPPDSAAASTLQLVAVRRGGALRSSLGMLHAGQTLAAEFAAEARLAEGEPNPDPTPAEGGAAEGGAAEWTQQPSLLYIRPFDEPTLRYAPRSRAT